MTTNNITLSADSLKQALLVAHQEPYQPQRASGCGRAYVVLTGIAKGKGRKATLKLYEDACKSLGLLFLKEAYGVGKIPCIYIGYDNCDGKALAKSVVFAAKLREQGIPCYDEAVAD